MLLNKNLLRVTVCWCLILACGFLVAPRLQAESSFSALGYGLPEDGSSSRTAAMGLVALALPDTLSLNLRTPALWMHNANTRFGLHFQMSRTITEDESGTSLSDRGSLSGGGFVFPVGANTYFGITLSPYTQMAYDWPASSAPATQSWTETIVDQSGRGGLTQSLVGISVPVLTNFRLGLGARVIFGKNERRWEVRFPNVDAKPAVQTISDRYRSAGVALSGFWHNSAGWSGAWSVNSPVSVIVERQLIVRSDATFVVDSTWIVDQNYDLPFDIAVGLGKSFLHHRFGAELEWHSWDLAVQPVILTEDFRNSLRMGAGWERITEYRAYNSFWQNLIYRAGFGIQQHYAVGLTGHRASQYSVSGGVGIPYFEGLSRLDLSLTAGLMGSREDDGAAEKFILLKIGFNHSERWFVSRRESR